MKKINILLTGVGSPGGPGIIKLLRDDKRFNLITCDSNNQASGKYLSTNFFQIPAAKDDAFIEGVLKICEQQNIDFIFPLVTLELFKFAAAKKEFENRNIKVIVSNNDNLQIVNDKIKLYDHLKSKQIRIPAYRSVKYYNKLEEAVFELGYPNIPVCIKPAISNGSRGFRIIKNDIDEFDAFFNEKPNNQYINLGKLLDILKGKKFPPLLVSEFMPGEEYSVDCMLDNGKIQFIIPRKRIKINNGISTKGQFEKNESIIEYCRDILNSIELHGPIGIQLKKGSDGLYKILEINPRIQGTSSALYGAGINFPLACIENEMGLDVSKYLNEFNWDIGFARYYDEIFYSLE